jgi:hypothetical protein
VADADDRDPVLDAAEEVAIEPVGHGRQYHALRGGANPTGAHSP